MAGQRIKYVSYLQIIGIVLVVFGHSFHQYPGGGRTLLFEILHSFRMPLFMFTSGFLLVYTTRNRPRAWKELAAAKVKRLLVPFIVLSALAFVPRCLMSGMADDAMEVSWRSFWTHITDGDSLVIPYLWFLQASFTLLLLVYGVILMAGRWNIPPVAYYLVLICVIVALNLLPVNYTSFFSLADSIRLAIFFVMGCGYSEWSRRHSDRVIPYQNPWVLILFATLWGVSFYFLYGRGYLADLVCSSFGIAMVVSLAKLLDARNIGVLDHLIGTNYLIFLLSWFFNVGSQQVLAHYVSLPWWVHTVLSLVLAIYAPWAIYRWMERHSQNKFVRALAFLLGQSFSK